MARDTGTIILYGGAVVLGYYVLKSWGIIQTPCDPSICTPECPRGPKYSRGYFGTCDPGYLMCDLDTNCCCIAAPQTAQMNSWKPLSESELENIRRKIQ